MERDFPVGHPAAADYKGESYTPPLSPHMHDFDERHPAAHGKNITPLDTPDGMRAAQNKAQSELQELAAVGSLPPVIDPASGEPLPLTPEQLALVYAVRKGLSLAGQRAVTEKYGLQPIREVPSVDAVPALTAEQQAINYIISLKYTPERAKEILDQYGAPSILGQKEADAHR